MSRSICRFAWMLAIVPPNFPRMCRASRSRWWEDRGASVRPLRHALGASVGYDDVATHSARSAWRLPLIDVPGMGRVAEAAHQALDACARDQDVWGVVQGHEERVLRHVPVQ